MTAMNLCSTFALAVYIYGWCSYYIDTKVSTDFGVMFFGLVITGLFFLQGLVEIA